MGVDEWDVHQYATMGSCDLSSSARWRYGEIDLSSGVRGGSASGFEFAMLRDGCGQRR